MTDITDKLIAYPGVRKIAATTEELRAALLKYDGQMLLNGELWNIKSKKLGAGVYSVWLEIAAAKEGK